MPTRTRARKAEGRSGLGPSPAKLTINEQITLNSLAALIGGQRLRVSTRQLAEHSGIIQQTVWNALGGLERKGLLESTKGRGAGNSFMRELTISGVHRTTRAVGDFGPLPDAFRVGDLRGPGWLWSWAEKGVPMHFGDAWTYFPSAGRKTIQRYLNRLMHELAVPAVELTKDTDDPRRNLYTFAPLTDAELARNFEDLNERLPGWRPKALAGMQDRHDRERLEIREKLGDARYVDMVPIILESCFQVPWPEDQSPTGPGIPWNVGCLEGPEGMRDAAGYIRVPEVGTYARAHRIVYHAMRGPIGIGNQIHHMCGNPSCLNIRHLAEVTREEHRVITDAERPMWQAVKHGKPITVTVQATAPIYVTGTGDIIEDAA